MNIRIHFRFKENKHTTQNLRIVSIVGQISSEIKEGILQNRYIGLEGTYAKEYLKGDVTYDSIRPKGYRFLICKIDNPKNSKDYYTLGPNSLNMLETFLKEHNINI